MFGNIASEDRGELTPHHFEHLIPLAQCALDIIIHRANSSGVQLVSPSPASSQRDMHSDPVEPCLLL